MMLYPIASSSAGLLTSEDLGRLRECANEEEGCGWLFLDCSKSQGWRWCSMEGCGNRVKFKTYYDRHLRVKQAYLNADRARFISGASCFTYDLSGANHLIDAVLDCVRCGGFHRVYVEHRHSNDKVVEIVHIKYCPINKEPYDEHSFEGGRIIYGREVKPTS